jgi:hypothetical protein
LTVFWFKPILPHRQRRANDMLYAVIGTKMHVMEIEALQPGGALTIAGELIFETKIAG